MKAICNADRFCACELAQQNGNAGQVITRLTGWIMQCTYTHAHSAQPRNRPDPLSRGSPWGSGHETTKIPTIFSFSHLCLQLKHTGWEENPGGYVYTNYQQISLVKSGGEDPITLPLGHNVEKGDLIAYGYRESNFVNIHFEVRDGGTISKYSSNPWKYMPNSANDYTSFDTASVSLKTNYNNVECQAVVNVSVPPNLLTFNRVELHNLDSSDTPQKVRFYDMCGINTNRTTSQINDQNYREDPNDASSYLIRISPKPFFYNPDTNLPASAEYGFEFVDLPSLAGGGRVMAKIFDVFGNSTPTDYFDYTCSEGTTTAPTTTTTSSTTATSSTTPTEESSCSGCTRNDRIWPISGTTTVDLPQSVPYGSRRYYSSGRYSILWLKVSFKVSDTYLPM